MVNLIQFPATSQKGDISPGAQQMGLRKRWCTLPKGRRLVYGAVAIAVGLGASGCAQFRSFSDENNWDESREQFTGVDKHSSFPAVRRITFEQVNLIELVDPHRRAKSLYGAARPVALGHESKEISFGVRYDLALAAFREAPETATNSKLAHRNSVQDRILSVATSRCNVFKTYLRRQQADTNFFFGTATTVAGVLGAVLPGATASRNLAGAAGLFSGVQAEYNSSYYSNLAAHVIVQGIETHQARLLTRIIEERSKRSVADYSMEAAIRDAIHYDGTCSTVVGLAEAAESIKEVTNPGLPRAAEVVASVKAMQQIAQTSDINALMKSGELQQLLKQTAPKSSPLIVMSTKPQAPSVDLAQRLSNANQASERLRTHINKHANELAEVYKSTQSKLAQSASKGDPTLGESAKGRFSEKLKEWNEAYGIPTCVANLAAPSSAYWDAYSKQAIAKEATIDRINADAALGRAEVSINEAVEWVEWRLAQAQADVNAQAERWREALASVSVSPTLDMLTINEPTSVALANGQCK